MFFFVCLCLFGVLMRGSYSVSSQMPWDVCSSVGEHWLSLHTLAVCFCFSRPRVCLYVCFWCWCELAALSAHKCPGMCVRRLAIIGSRSARYLSFSYYQSCGCSFVLLCLLTKVLNEGVLQGVGGWGGRAGVMLPQGYWAPNSCCFS